MDEQVEKLRAEAKKLALLEIAAEQVCRREREALAACPRSRSILGYSREEKERLRAYEEAKTARETLLDALDEARRSVSRLKMQSDRTRGREFFFDVPFDPAQPREKKTDLTFPNPIFMVSEPLSFEENGFRTRLLLKPRMEQAAFTLRMLQIEELQILMHLDKKLIQAYPGETCEIREIYQIQMDYDRMKVISWINQDLSVSPEYLAYKAQLVESEDRFRDELRALEEKDERIGRMMMAWQFGNPLSVDTNYAIGNLSEEDWLSFQMARTARETNAMERNMREQGRLMFQAQQAQDEYARSFVHVLRDAEYERKNMKLLPVGQVVYLKGAVALICLYKEYKPLYSFVCGPDVQPDHLQGDLYDCRILEERRPDPCDVLPFLIDLYQPYLPPYSVLGKRLRGASDEEWRLYARLSLLRQLQTNRRS